MSGRAILIEQLLDSHFKSYILLAYDREGGHCSAVEKAWKLNSTPLKV